MVHVRVCTKNICAHVSVCMYSTRMCVCTHIRYTSTFKSPMADAIINSSVNNNRV